MGNYCGIYSQVRKSWEERHVILSITHTQQGANGMVISAIGDDNLGMEIMDVLKEKKIFTGLIQVNDRPTSKVDVTLNRGGIPEYRIHENVAWDYIKFNQKIAKLVS